MNSDIIISDINELIQVGEHILEAFPNIQVFAFYAEMGTGKTTTIKEIAKFMGYTGPSSSPTYSLVLEYPLEKTKIFHFDLYRCKTIDEVYNLGIEDYLNQDAYVFIEWPEIIEPILNKIEHVKISIQNDELKKVFKFTHFKP